jgi:ADYC domain
MISVHRTLAVFAVLLAAGTRAAFAMGGIEMNGIEMNGVSLDDVTLGGTSLTDVHLEGSTFNGTRRDGTAVTGEDFVGARLKGTTVTGAKVQVRIDGYSQAGDVSSYAVSFVYDDGDSAWRSVCTSGGDAIPLNGTWNADGSKNSSDPLVTFACPGGALAKCVDFGYAPWRSQGGTSLAPYHQACTRAIRADYCGDGTPYTQDGNVIDLYDVIGVLDDAAAWTPEAEWNEGGATCLSGRATRATVPVACEAQKLDPSCGAGGPSAGTLLVTELP